MIDDNQKDVELLFRILNSTKQLKLVKKYMDAIQLEKELTDLHLDFEIAFIKTWVFGQNGITIAKRLKKIRPNIQIVFISKEKEFAVDAFELGAIDYILQPYNKNRIYKTVNRLLKNKNTSLPRESVDMVCCFKHLHFKDHKQEIIPVRWRTTKTKELFAFLIQNRNELMVRKDVLIELLWPEEDVNKAFENLYSCIYEIRKLLKQIGANIQIISIDSAYEVILNDVKCDVDEWVAGINDLPFISEETLPKALTLINQYTGDYLADETYMWKENEQESLRMLYQAFSNKVLRYLIANEQYTKATLLALRNQRLNPYLADSYYFLMKIYDKLGDIYNVEKQFSKLVEMFKTEFNTVPPIHIKDWYRKWIEKQVKTPEI